MVRRLIVNADDFGLTAGVNRGIVESFRFGIVRSTSLMVNMPGFADAVALARQNTGLAVGLHFNLTYGGPVAPVEEVPSLVDGSGHFVKDKERISQHASPHEIALELGAQTRLFQSTGLPLNHIDTHHDLHRWEPVLGLVSSLAHALRVPVRCLDERALATKGVRSRGRFVNYFGGPEPVERLLELIRSLPEGTVEIPCHPGYVDDDLRSVSTLSSERLGELRALTHPTVGQCIAAEGIVLAGA